MKKLLIQLDTDHHPSAFDAIAAYDADVDVVMAYGDITAENLGDVVQGAIFPRGPDGLANTAFWVGGSKVRDGEAVFTAAKKLFFKPFNPSIMLDSDGSNTTAAAAVARVRALASELGRPVDTGGGFGAEDDAGTPTADRLWRLCAEAPLGPFDRQRLLEANGTERPALLAELATALGDDLAALL